MFKFYRVSDLDVLEKIIGGCPTIKFSSAFNLNDPYELKFNLTYDSSAKEHEIEYFKANSSHSIVDFERWKNQVNDNFIWYQAQEQRNTLAQLITLSSFSERNDNNLMWSHYTDNYKGICVEYSKDLIEYLQENTNFLAFAKVSYSDYPPQVNTVESQEIKLQKMVFNKQSEWNYEQELRVVIISRNDTDFIPINQKFIKSIYIAPKLPKALSERIVDIGKQQGIKIYYAITMSDSYKIHFAEHKDRTFYTKSFWG